MRLKLSAELTSINRFWTIAAATVMRLPRTFLRVRRHGEFFHASDKREAD
jgi:hypothetical protein